MKKIITISILIVAAILCSVDSIYAANKFYDGKEATSKVTTWRRKCTKNFCVMYKDKYIDPEKILCELSEKFGIKPRISGIKIKVFIQEGRAYMKPGSKKVYVWDEAGLRHELTHILFCQINRHAPFAIREGIAVYAQYKESPRLPKVDVTEIVKLEKELERVPKSRRNNGVYGGRSNRTIEKMLYEKGHCFVANLIKEKGIENFKKFYKKCSGNYRIEKAWKEIYK